MIVIFGPYQTDIPFTQQVHECNDPTTTWACTCMLRVRICRRDQMGVHLIVVRLHCHSEIPFRPEVQCSKQPSGPTQECERDSFAKLSGIHFTSAGDICATWFDVCDHGFIKFFLWYHPLFSPQYRMLKPESLTIPWQPKVPVLVTTFCG